MSAFPFLKNWLSVDFNFTNRMKMLRCPAPKAAALPRTKEKIILFLRSKSAMGWVYSAHGAASIYHNP
jgi:hypothetical protein